MGNSEIKQVLEALIFVSDKPLGIVQIKEVISDIKEEQVYRFIEELNQEYLSAGRSFTIQQVAGGFRMSTRPQLAPWLKALYKSKMKERLSRPSLETLAIIAYKQPVTKLEVEKIRGVNVDGVLTTLLERNLIKITGRKDSVGRPILYATTDDFLGHFGLSAISDMPKLPELEQLTDTLQHPAPMEGLRVQEEQKNAGTISEENIKNGTCETS